MNRLQMVGVALAIPPGLPPSLNQQLLFVDQLALVGLDQVTEDVEGLSRTWPYEPSHILRLRDAGVAIALPEFLRSDLLSDPDARAALESASVASRACEEVMAEMPLVLQPGDGATFNRIMSQLSQQVELSRSFVARAHAIAARLYDGMNAVSLLPVLPEQRSGAVLRDEAIRIVISSLPCPSDDVPPLEIIRFREDPDNRERLLAIRTWAAAVARGTISAIEMREQLESILATYTAALQHLERKYTTGKLEMVLSGVPEIISQIVTGEFAKAAGSLFTITNAHARLLEEERSLPGRELSYILSAHRRFGSGA